jgi:plastocyanin
MTRALAALLATVTLAVAGCGGGGEQPASSTTSTTAAESADRVEIADFAYAPDAVTVDVGTKLTWANADNAAHTATADDGSFDTGTLKQGESGAVTLDEAGTYTYFCRFHPFMQGTVEVR